MCCTSGPVGRSASLMDKQMRFSCSARVGLCAGRKRAEPEGRLASSVATSVERAWRHMGCSIKRRCSGILARGAAAGAAPVVLRSGGLYERSAWQHGAACSTAVCCEQQVALTCLLGSDSTNTQPACGFVLASMAASTLACACLPHRAHVLPFPGLVVVQRFTGCRDGHLIPAALLLVKAIAVSVVSCATDACRHNLSWLEQRCQVGVGVAG